MKRFGVMSLFALAMMVFTSMAWAQAAYVWRVTNLRAGPSRDYPLIVQLPAGYQVTVVGCLNGYVWCDVIADGNRGWMYAGNIRYLYQNSYVPVREYGPRIGIAIIGFVLGNYWGAHYQHRPWYSERDRWQRRHPTPYHPLRPNRPNLHRTPPPARRYVPQNRHNERSMQRAPMHRGTVTPRREINRREINKREVNRHESRGNERGNDRGNRDRGDHR